MDLDINNYNHYDLERFLGLHTPYTNSNIEERAYHIRELLLSSGHVNKQFKAQLVLFIDKAKEKLRNECVRVDQDLKRTYSRIPSSIPKQVRILENKENTHAHIAAAAVSASASAAITTIRALEPDTHQHSLLIQTPKTEILYEETSQIPRPFRVLNPNEKRITTKLICIDTLFRENYANTKSSDFNYKLNTHVPNVVSMNLTSIEIPFFWYTISAENFNNILYITISNLQYQLETIQTSSTQYKIVVPDGNYTAAQITQVITNIFQAPYIDPSTSHISTDSPYATADSGNTTTINALNCLICTYDQINLKTIIRVCDPLIDQQTITNSLIYPFTAENTPFFNQTFGGYDNVTNVFYSPNMTILVELIDLSTVPPSSKIPPFYRSLGWTLGFRNHSYLINQLAQNMSFTSNINYPNLATSASTYVVVNLFKGFLASEAAYGANVDNYIFIAIDDFHNNYPSDTVCMINSFNKSLVGKNIIGRVTLSQNFNQVILDNNSDIVFKKREYFGPVSIEKLHISLINRYGDIIAINNQDFSLTLELKQVYS